MMNEEFSEDDTGSASGASGSAETDGRRRRGATAVEYALIVALIAGVLITIVGLVGFQAGGMWSKPVDGLQNQGW